MQPRIDRVRERLAGHGCDAFISMTPPVNQYLSGFRGTTSVLLITEQHALFLCDFRYTEQAQDQVSGYDIRELSGRLLVRAGETVAEMGLSRVAFEPQYTTYGEIHALQQGAGDVFVPVDALASKLREVKEPGEIALIREASELAEGVLADLRPFIGEGVQERELAARFEYEFKKRGASGASFDTIALFGARSSLPHGEPGAAALQPEDTVLIDCGCRRAGYCSDLTRTYVFGRMPDVWFQNIYEVTLTAQRNALAAIRPGVTCREVDAAARDVITEAGFGEQFGHGLGHGVGVEVHEAPRLNPQSETLLEAGMVITVEPGVYLPGQGGVRIEDLVAVTSDGCDVLTRTPKELEILVK